MPTFCNDFFSFLEILKLEIDLISMYVVLIQYFEYAWAPFQAVIINQVPKITSRFLIDLLGFLRIYLTIAI